MPKSKVIRKERSILLLNDLAWSCSSHLCYRNDLAVDEVYICRNSRVISKDCPCVPAVIQWKHPTSVMVFGAVEFIEAGLKINMAVYMK